MRWEPESSIILYFQLQRPYSCATTQNYAYCVHAGTCTCVYVHVVVYVHVHVHVVEMMKPVTFIILSPGVIPALSAELP